MVLVEPPPDWSPAETEAPPVAAPPEAAELTAEPPVPPADPATEFDSGDAVAEGPPVEPPPMTLQHVESDAEPIVPTDDWTSHAARQRQQWLMLGGAAALGVALSFGLLGVFASRVANKTTADNVPAPVDTKPPRADDSSAASDEVADPEPAATPAAKPAGEAVTESADDPARTADDPEPQAAPAPPGAAQGEPEVRPSPDKKVKEVPDTPPRDEADARPAGQPGADASEQPPESPRTAEAAKPAEGGLDPGSLAESLKAFAPFIDPGTFVPPATMDDAGTDVPPLDPQTLTTAQPSVPRPEPRPVDLSARLQDKIVEVEFAGVPLKNFLRFIMNFSTIPVSVDPDALALVRTSLETKIHVRSTDITVDQLLTSVLGPLQLAHVADDQHLVVTRPPVAGGGLRTVAHGVSDLVGDDPEQLARLAERIAEMVVPASWEAAGGPGIIREELPSLVFQQQETILFQAIVFCERLRAARGLPPQSKFDPTLFSLKPRLARAAQRLAAPVTVNFPQPTALTRILDRMSDESGVEILVDWKALMELGWPPETETTMTVNQQPLGSTLSTMLQPMDLTYRVLGAARVEVTSPAAVESRWDIEFYPLPALEDGSETPDAVLTRLRTELTGGNPAALAGVLDFDPPSRHLIAALPQGEQQRLAELLRNRGDAPD